MFGRWEIELIKQIQQISNPILDQIALWLTNLGGIYVVVGCIFILYWVVNKKTAFKFVIAYLVSAVANQGLKQLFEYPRPFDNGAISIGEASTGYTFPSGHAQTTAVTTTFLFLEYNKKVKWLKWVLLAVLIIVPLTRMYLGQHYLTDVLFGVWIGIVITYFVWRFFFIFGDKEHIVGLIAIIPVFAVLTWILITHNYYQDYLEIVTVGGAFIGFMLGYFLEKVFVKTPMPTKWWKIVLRLLIGGLSVVGIVYGIGTFLPPQNLLYPMLLYFGAALFGTYILMLAFKALKI